MVQQRTALVIAAASIGRLAVLPIALPHPLHLAHVSCIGHSTATLPVPINRPINHGRLPRGRLPFAGPLDK